MEAIIIGVEGCQRWEHGGGDPLLSLSLISAGDGHPSGSWSDVQRRRPMLGRDGRSALTSTANGRGVARILGFGSGVFWRQWQIHVLFFVMSGENHLSKSRRICVRMIQDYERAHSKS